MSGDREASATELSTVVNAYLSSAGLLERSREGLCAFLWAKVAGKWYARHSYVTSVRDGVVNVRCDSAPRAQQLQLDSPAIIERLNEEMGEKYVTQIRASSAGIDRRSTEVAPTEDEPTSRNPTPDELQEIKLPPEAIEQIAECAQQAPVEYRDRLERIMLAQARVQLWRRDQGFAQCPDCGTYHPGDEDYCLACRPPEAPVNAGGEEGLSKFFE